MSQPAGPPAGPTQPQSQLVALASKFTVAGLIRLVTTIAGLVLSADSAYYATSRWYVAAVAVASGLGIYAVHNPPSKS